MAVPGLRNISNSFAGAAALALISAKSPAQEPLVPWFAHNSEDLTVISQNPAEKDPDGVNRFVLHCPESPTALTLSATHGAVAFVGALTRGQIESEIRHRTENPPPGDPLLTRLKGRFTGLIDADGNATPDLTDERFLKALKDKLAKDGSKGVRADNPALVKNLKKQVENLCRSHF